MDDARRQPKADVEDEQGPGWMGQETGRKSKEAGHVSLSGGLAPQHTRSQNQGQIRGDFGKMCVIAASFEQF